jgi:hypothetical protein
VVFFSNKQAMENALPLTKAALQQHILRSHFQSAVWKSSIKAFPEIGTPNNHGWEIFEDIFIPIMTLNSAAPNTIMEIRKCDCKKGCNSNVCSCKQQQLTCTEMCGCSVHECLNVFQKDDYCIYK